MKRQTLLIATTNKGKQAQIKQTLGSSAFTLVFLDDLDTKIPAPEESADTLEGNAIIKAKAYGDASGMLTLAEDTGLFITALGGWPGVKSARVAQTSDELCLLALEKMKEIPQKDRGAYFKSVVAVYDPKEKSIFLGTGEKHGEIATDIVEVTETQKQSIGQIFGYNRIFIYTDIQKRASEMSGQEREEHKHHRSVALHQAKHFLQNQYGGKHFVVPIAIIVRDGKILMNKRNDPHNPQFHGVWEFPGGTVEIGENIEENVVRESKEETGYDVETLEQLPFIRVKTRHIERFSYQIYLVPILCKVVGGDGIFSEEEVLEMQWYSPEEIPSLTLFPDDGNMVSEYLEMIQDAISRNGL